ncbi:MAG: dTDP-4-dehydrorhamnose 3,5-epimerase family protein [Chloroflexi bacterium]|nr:dTDP-4-dehydrorhamnose 3,5-epimerase family protein [Chloroflexota bacterium]
MAEVRVTMDGVRMVGGDTLIEGVKIIPLRRIPDERGTVFHMLRSTDPHFIQFGEIYFSTVYPEVIKGWHKHREMTLNYACIYGRIKLVLYDERHNSPTRGTVVEVFLGADNYSLVVIPPEVWNGFKGLSDPYAIVANCCTHAHDPSRSTRLDPFENHIPYEWTVKHQ